MNQHLVLGLFALVIVAVSLLRLLSDQEFFRLTAMKKAWGRTRGLAMHFLGNVGLPLIAGIVFVAYGTASFRPVSGRSYDSLPATLSYGNYLALTKTIVHSQGLAAADRHTFEFFVCP